MHQPNSEIAANRIGRSKMAGGGPCQSGALQTFRLNGFSGFSAFRKERVMLTPLEMNVGLAACGPAGDSRDMFDILGQGRADLYFARQFARLRRAWNNSAAAERHIYALAKVAALTFFAIKADGRLSEDKQADLLSFIFERGMNMVARQ